MAQKRPKIIVILGPTATGKSALAVFLAKKIGGEVISADSRQVYKGMDKGSGKITKKEMRGISHYLLDVANPKTVFNAEKFKKLGHDAVEKILKKGKTPIVCGGTGFYIDSLLYDLSFPDVLPQPKLRKKLQKLECAKLFLKLQKLDPRRAKEMDSKNKVRIIRAIEIAEALGKVPKQTKKEKYDALKIGLDLPNDALKKRIAARLLARIEDGMIGEVKNLHKKGLSWKRLESFGLEYRYIAQFLQKKISKEEMIEKIKNESFHFAKRQRTWFKRDTNIHWISPKDKKKAAVLAKNFLEASN